MFDWGPPASPGAAPGGDIETAAHGDGLLPHEDSLHPEAMHWADGDGSFWEALHARPEMPAASPDDGAIPAQARPKRKVN